MSATNIQAFQNAVKQMGGVHSTFVTPQASWFRFELSDGSLIVLEDPTHERVSMLVREAERYSHSPCYGIYASLQILVACRDEVESNQVVWYPPAASAKNPENWITFQEWLKGSQKLQKVA